MANIKPVKQIDTLVRAAAKVRSQTGQRVDYHIIGAIADQDCANKLRQLIDEHELSENFFLHGAVPGVRAMLSDFDIGVLTSSSEGLSNTVLEYLQAGLATVVSDTGGNPEIIDDGINGLLFVPGDSHQLAERLARLISDQDQRARLGNAAQESAQAFSTTAMSDAYEGIYRGTTDHWHANESP